jgi:putative ABC transport system substrate-binding protein
VRRREFIALGGAIMLAPLSARAQQPRKVLKVGFLYPGSFEISRSRIDAILHGLRIAGYRQPEDFQLIARVAENDDARLRTLAAGLVEEQVDVIITGGSQGVRAAMGATTTIPIVIAVAGDVVDAGFVADLARPGGNITGQTFFNPELMAKRLELLKEAIPQLARVGVFLNPTNPRNIAILKAMESTADRISIKLQQFEVRRPEEFNDAFATMTKERVDAVVVHEDAMLLANDKVIAELAARTRIPLAGSKELAKVGGLIGYGVNFLDMWRTSAVFVVKILKGAKPGELPIQRPINIELVINLRTATSLGISVQPSVLLRANEVIE